MTWGQAYLLCLATFCSLCLQSALMHLEANEYIQNSLKIEVSSDLNLCDNATLLCKVQPADSIIWWSVADMNVTEDERHIREYTVDNEIAILKMTIVCVSFDDVKNYTCHASSGDLDDEIYDTVYLNISVPPEVIETQYDRVKSGDPATLLCNFTGYPLDDFKWLKIGETLPINHVSETKKWNETFYTSVLRFDTVNRKDNGTYRCTAVGLQKPVGANVPLFVLAIPQVNVDFVTAVGAHRIFLNWTVNDGNEPVEEYFIQHMKNGTNQWTYYQEHIGSGNSSYILKNLEPNTTYKLRLKAKNSVGMSSIYTYPTAIQTLDSDPDFVPEISVKGVTSNSITIGWCQPPASLKGHIHYYQLLIQNNDTKAEAIHPASEMLLYLFVDLKPATAYHFKVAACSEYTRQCGNWSVEVNGTTMDGVSGPPENVTVVCHFDNVSSSSFVIVTWTPPRRPNGKIDRYNVILMGEATYKNEKGELKKLNWEPKLTSVDEKSRIAHFKFIPPNTNYTVRVAGVTRSRSSGEEATGHCQMPPTIPSRDKLAHFFWVKVNEQGQWIFKLLLPRISERNGPICCYRVYLVKLEPQQSIVELPSPEDFPVSSYEEVHRNKKGGAYVAEMFESDALNNEVFLGDGHYLQVNSSACLQCIGVRSGQLKTTTILPPTVQTNILLPAVGTGLANEILPVSDPTIRSSPEPIQAIQTDALSASKLVMDQLIVHDGNLDINSNYTGFLEVIVYGINRTLLPAYSDYFEQLNPGPEVTPVAESSQILAIVLQLLCALILLVLVLLVSLCLLQRYTKQVAQVQGVEMTLTNSFRHLCRSLRGRHILVSSSPPDMPPIAKGELTIAYLERHRDSDYGFQYEFELLPDRFPDRTTRNSEARENLYKNRYPDIKAYDQTRVRLSQIDSVVGSDYINANFVMGYKERKKFICAQGPMDNTVCDFWRMIWEQHLEMILMLTNLEEYSKTKCAKYWPDDAEGEKVFGDITLSHVQEKRYSDYIIRELKMCKSYSGTQEFRSIVQYHFLVWKDFMAPEHPSGILKFIKRMNEAYSLEKGPILVHCSAGVGRTGTLVALDSLLQQLHEEDQVAIFNTVCDLRHQRNFLVQSLKQYIFIYRALMEVAQFGGTELKVSQLKGEVEKLRQRENGKDKNKMEEEFEKISRVLEDHKSFSVGRGDENQTKNRSELIIPYDRNRVILTPIPGREHSTYINASFIEGYDNSESFIITQDPLEITVPDFWRMISEQGISTLVMLSDVGDGVKKCLRYWPDDETSHEHIHVKYIQSESCPYYTRREFSVMNTKTDENTLVTQFQYNGWPTVEGEVPEVTRGLIELVDQTQSHQESHGGSAPICVHCCYGSDRSSMFVALTILVQQLRIEKRVDIFTTTRKLRSQRHGMLQTFAQYEFLHRAIVNYTDLHRLADEDP